MAPPFLVRAQPDTYHCFIEILRLMCCIIYMKNIKSSPYADLFAPNTNADIQHTFTRDFCSLIGLSCDSPLYVRYLAARLT